MQKFVKMNVLACGLMTFLLFLTTAVMAQKVGITDASSLTPNCLLQLHLNASSGTMLQLSNTQSGTGTTNGLLFISSNTGSVFDMEIKNAENGTLTLTTGNNYMSFNTNSNERIRIAANGNVGIGTTSPANKLDVKGTLSFTNSSDNYVGFQAPSGTFTNFVLKWPNADGAAGQFLTTDGAGNLSWMYIDGIATTKTANATLTKSETLIGASNNITLTLPIVTAADNGLMISIKNIGTYSDLVTIQGNSGATIDGLSNTSLTRYVAQSFIAFNGNWLIRNKEAQYDNVLKVSANSSWTTIPEVLAFLRLHMTNATVVQLGDAEYSLTASQVINFPYPLTIEGTSYGSVTVKAASGLAGKAMFRCLTECYFKMLMFDATSLAGYGTGVGEDAIRLCGNGNYHEIKDCTFDRFYNAIVDSANAELWLFECDISNSQKNGVVLSSATSGVKLRVAETDFISCVKGINLHKGSNAIVQLQSGTYLNANATDTGIIYNPAAFSFSKMFITGNSYSNIGKFVEGFDFTRSDGRDANAYVQYNPGLEDKNPHCKISVQNNVSTTTLTNATTWYKAAWTNTSAYTCKWTILNNKIIYQPVNKRDAWMMITGNFTPGTSSTRVFTIGIAKNGSTSTMYGETNLRTNSTNPFQFSTIIYIEDVGPADYFELYVSCNSPGNTAIFEDVQWYTETR